MFEAFRSRAQAITGDVCFVHLSVRLNEDVLEVGSLWETLDKREAEFRRQVQQTVKETLGADFDVRALTFGRGSIEILVLIGTTYYVISQYKSFVEGIELMVRQLKEVARLWFDNQSTGSADVATSWSPAAGLSRPNTTSRECSTGWDGRVLWYLVTSHAAMLEVLLWLAAEALRP